MNRLFRKLRRRWYRFRHRRIKPRVIRNVRIAAPGLGRRIMAAREIREPKNDR